MTLPNVGDRLGADGPDAPAPNLTVGSRVRCERDEKLYPSKGTWPYYRGKTGTVVEHNLGEVGVCFSKVTPAPMGGDVSATTPATCIGCSLGRSPR